MYLLIDLLMDLLDIKLYMKEFFSIFQKALPFILHMWEILSGKKD